MWFHFKIKKNKEKNSECFRPIKVIWVSINLIVLFLILALILKKYYNHSVLSF